MAGFDTILLGAYVEQLGGTLSSLTIDDMLSTSLLELFTALDETVVDSVPLQALQKSKLRRFLRKIAEIGGAPSPDFGTLSGPAQAPTRPAAKAPPPVPAARKRKLAALIDQADDGDVELLPAPRIAALWADFERAHGGGPREREDATGDQLSALAAKLAEDMVFVGGELVTRQLRGPSSFDTWRACWRVFRTAMLVLKARVANGCYAGSFDKDRPWESVIRDSAKSESSPHANWWCERVDKLCLLASRRGAVPQALQAAGGNDDKKKRGLAGIERRKDGRHLRAADGSQLCFSWNRSEKGCTDSRCPQGRAHSCEWCLGSHRAIDPECPAKPRGWVPPPPGRPRAAQRGPPAPRASREGAAPPLKVARTAQEASGAAEGATPSSRAAPAGAAAAIAAPHPGARPSAEQALATATLLGLAAASAARRAAAAAAAPVLAQEAPETAPGETPVSRRARLSRQRQSLQDVLGRLQRLGASLAEEEPRFVALSEFGDPAPVRRHASRGVDPVDTREQRGQEDAARRAGLRNAAAAVASEPALLRVMGQVRLAIRGAQSEDASLTGLAGCCGETPARAPPSQAAAAALRAKVARALGVEPGGELRHHPASNMRFRSAQQVISLAEGPDREVGRWLEEGAPMGISRAVVPGGLFPLAESCSTLEPGDLGTGDYAFLANHPSFADKHDEAEAPSLDLIRGCLKSGYGETFDTVAAAEAKFGRVFPAPLGNVRRQKRDGTFKNRIIQDLKANGVNRASTTRERVVLPRGSITRIPLHEDEGRFNVAILEEPPMAGHGRVIVWRVLGFGGKANPLVHGRVGSLLARSAQAMLSASEGRLQLYVDDPASTLAGSDEGIHCNLDTVLGWWLALGLGLAWRKGVFTLGAHVWVGIQFELRGAVAYMALMTLPPEFLKVSRIAQVVQEAYPFAASFWAALVAAEQAAASARPEAPPGRVAIRRFAAAAAAWVRALIRGAVLPLAREVHHRPDLRRLPAALVHVEFDAPPWVGGAILFEKGAPREYLAFTWSDKLLQRFSAEIGNSKWQTLWEYVTLLVTLLARGAPFAVGQVLTIKGGNLAALAGAVYYRGRRDLNAVTRELSWRKAAVRWTCTVSHLPPEANELAGALS
ncbi:unnamed protein product, partial [Prorocentrum cordatum]